MPAARLKSLAYSFLSRSDRVRNALGLARGRTNRSPLPAILNCAVFYNEFGGYCVPRSSRHRPAAQKIMAGDVWEKPTIAFMTSVCNGGDIVHAGTYFGDFLPALSRAAGHGTVWAFEPNPENHRCAAITILLNDLRNVHLVNAALDHTSRTAALVTRSGDGRSLGGASHLADAGERGDVAIPTVAVDDVVPADRHVTVLQLDVEGHEQAALSGAMQTITRCRPTILLETPPQEWLSAHLLPLGYAVAGTVADNLILQPER